MKGIRINRHTLVADKSGRTLVERINALVKLVTEDAGATRVETATSYAFGLVKGGGRVEADKNLDQIIRRLTVQIFPVGREIYVELVLQLTPVLPGVTLEQLSWVLDYEIPEAGLPLILTRYLYPPDWKSQDVLDKILADFTRQANEIYLLKCEEYKEENNG